MAQQNTIFLQARLGSTRFPNKVMKTICGKPIIELIIDRLSNIKNIKNIVILTGNSPKNNELIKFATTKNIPYFVGSEENLLDRFYQASKVFESDNIIRVNADCPLIDFNIINNGLDTFNKNNYDILSTDKIRTFPHGFDFEIFKSSSLKRAWGEISSFYPDKKIFENTFISPVKNMLENNSFLNFDLINDKNLSYIRLTLDYPEDFELITKIYHQLYSKNPKFAMKEILELLNENTELLDINKKHIQFPKQSLEEAKNESLYRK